jgi:hypothetical protein
LGQERPDVRGLAICFDDAHGARPGPPTGTARPFTTQETDLLGSATDDDMRAAASELAAAPERRPGALRSESGRACGRAPIVRFWLLGGAV